MSTVQRNEQELIKIEKLHELRSLGINPYPVSYDRTHHATEILETYTGDS
jgi:lysyl-tRNA synthetase class II